MKNKKKYILLSIIVILVVLLSISMLDTKRFYSKFKKYDDKYMIKVKYLVVDKDKVSDNIKMSETFPDHITDILYSQDQYVSLTKDGNYLYANLDEVTNDKLLKNTTDYAFALNDYHGNVINDCEYDKKTNIIKVPISYYQNKEQEVPIQVEIESLMTNAEMKKINVEGKVKNIFTRKLVSPQTSYNLETVVSLNEYSIFSISEDDLEIYINNSKTKVDKKLITFDKTNQTISIKVTPLLIDRIDIRIKNNLIPKAKATVAKVSFENMHQIEIPEKPIFPAGKDTYRIVLHRGQYHYCGDEEGANVCRGFWGEEPYLQYDTNFADYIYTYTDNEEVSWPSISGSGQVYYPFTFDVTPNDGDYYLDPNGSLDVSNPWGVERTYPYAINLKNLNVNSLDGDGDLFKATLSETDLTIPFYCVHVENEAVDGDIETYDLITYVQKIGEGTDWMVFHIYGLPTISGQAAHAYIKVHWNEDQEGSLTVTKKTKDGTTVTNGGIGWKINLYDSNNCTGSIVATKTTGNDSKAKFDGLQVGHTYSIKEVEYDGDTWVSAGCKSITTTSTPGQDGTYATTVDYTNRKRKYCIRAKKKDAETGNPIGGVTFGIYNVNNESQLVKSANTGTDGIATFNDIPKGSYKFKETGGSSGYWEDSSLSGAYSTTEMEYNESTGAYTCNATAQYEKPNRKKYYCFKVAKVDGNALKAGTTKYLPGFTFKGSGSYVDNTASKTTDNSGIVTFFTGTDSSARTVTETGAPVGYELSSKTLTVTPTLMSSGSSTNASNCNAPISTINAAAETDTSSNVFVNYKYVINWYKETEGGRAAAGAQFTVKNSSGTTIKHGANKVTFKDKSGTQKSCYEYGTSSDVFESDSNGEVCIVGVPKDTSGYTVTETKPVKYHTFGTKKTITVAIGTSFAAKNNNNKFINYPTTFKFTKTIKGENNDSLSINEIKRIPFSLYKIDGSTETKLTLIKTGDGTYEYKDNEIDGVTGTQTSTLYLNGDKNIIVKHLPVGSYGIKEDKVCCDSNCPNCTGTSECYGYYYPNYSQASFYKFDITECSSESATSCGSASIATKSLENTPTEINFTKSDLYSYADSTSTVKFEDEAERSAFDDIVFNLKDANGNVMKLVKVRNVGNCKTDSSYAEYRYVKESDLGSLTATEDLHTCGGHIKITHLCRGGKYTIVEKSVPENTVFTVATTPTKTFYVAYTEAGGACCDNPTTTPTKPGDTVVIDDEPTKIEITKIDNRTNSPIVEGTNKLNTAKFKVYRCNKSVSKCTKEASTGTPIKFKQLATVGTVKSYKFALNQSETSGVVTSLELTNINNAGKIVLTYLPANYKYVVVETDAPDGYYDVTGALAESEIATIGTSAGSVTKVNRTNYPVIIRFNKDDIYKYYKKTDAAKAGISDKIFDTMTFVLRDENGSVVTLKKVSDGEYRFIQADGTTNGNNVTNLHTKNGTLLITHLYRDKTYYIEETKADTEGNFILPNNVDNTSLVESKAGDLKNNKHPIVKYNAPDNLPSTSSLDDAPESLTEMIENLPGRVVFEKRDAKTNELIDDLANQDDERPNVFTTFNVYRCEKTVNSCTPSNGTIVYFEDRAYNNDLTSDITSVSNPIYVYNYNKLNANTGVTDLHTDRGVLVLAYLPTEYKYVLVETVAPNGYYLPVGAEAYNEFTVKASTLDDGSTYEKLTSKELNTPTEIHFIKSDMYDYYTENDKSKADSNVKIFDSMKFVIRDHDGNILKLKCSDNGNLVNATEDTCTTGEYRYLPVKSSENKITKMHPLNGEITITHLYNNSIYYIEEVEADAEGNFILPDNLEYTEELPFNHKGHPVVKYIVPESEPATAESVTKEIENKGTRVSFQKRDSKYGYIITDEKTTFEVYQCEKNVETCIPSNGTKINFTKRKVNDRDDEDYGKEVYNYSKLNESNNNTVSELHPYKGDLILRYLPSKYKYVLVETVSPDGYILPSGNSAYTEFTISSSRVDIEEVDVPNKPTSLVIKKYNDDGKLLSGAEFKIYKVTSYDANRTPANQQKELLSLKTRRDGVYEAREISDTNIVKTCEDTEYLKCSDINITLTYDDYIDTWADFDNSVNQSGESVQIVQGEAIIQYLDYDTYYVIEEVKAPKGYSLPEDSERYHLVYISKLVDVVDTAKELINKPTPFTFYKFDEYNNLIDGAEFKLQKLGDDKKYVDVAVTKEEKDDKLYYKVDKNSTNYIIETKNGSATVYYLEEGQYRILEVKAPEGKELPKKTINVATFFVDGNGNVYGNSIITNKSKTETTVYNPSAYAELIVNIQTGQKIVKYGLIIAILLVLIFGLIYFQKKKRK